MLVVHFIGWLVFKAANRVWVVLRDIKPSDLD